MCGIKSKLSVKIASIALAAGMVIASSAAWAGGNETRLRASLTGGPGDISGQADLKSRDGRRQFSVEVEGFSPGDMFDVTVGTANVGTIEIDAFGIGDLNYDDNFEPGDDDPATRFPTNFPDVNGGEPVLVGGDLSGTMQPK